MNIWVAILQILNAQMEVPALFGWFHLLWLAIMVAASVLLGLWSKKAKKEHINKFVLVMAIVTIGLEVYKQINYTFGDGSSAPSYSWYAFPWQFCSTPMYIGLLAGLLRKGKIYDSLCAYLATFALFAGLAVMLYPGNVFVETIGINIQTMVCHGGMVVTASVLLASGHAPIQFKTLLKAVPVFVVTLGIAMIMNEVAYQTGLLENHNFNMFYVSPYLEGTLPIYSQVQTMVPYPVGLAIYVVGFTAAAGIMLCGAKGIQALARKRKALAATKEQVSA